MVIYSGDEIYGDDITSGPAEIDADEYLARQPLPDDDELVAEVDADTGYPHEGER